MPKSINLASDYGFSRLERELVLPAFVGKLTALGSASTSFFRRWRRSISPGSRGGPTA